MDKTSLKRFLVFCRWKTIINDHSFDCQHSDVCTAGRVLFTQHHQTRPDPVWCAVHLLPPMRRRQNELWLTLVHTHAGKTTEYLLITIQCNDYTMVKPYDITNALWYWQLNIIDGDGKRNKHWKYRDNTWFGFTQMFHS